MGEKLTLTPVYKFEWDSGMSRRTDDEDVFAEEPSPNAVENLAHFGRNDDSCTVTLVEMGS